MSYSASVAFKQIKKKDVFGFINKFTNIIGDRQYQSKIIDNSYVFSPIFNFGHNIKTRENYDRLKKWTELWVVQCLTYKFSYIDEIGCLICGLSECEINKPLLELFDKVIYFQNSCDQDYPLTEWQEIKDFRRIYKKIDKMNNCNFFNKFYLSDRAEMWDDFAEDPNYYKRSKTYDLIWDIVEPYIFGVKDKFYLTAVNTFSDYYSLVNQVIRKYYDTHKEDYEKLFNKENNDE